MTANGDPRGERGVKAASDLKKHLKRYLLVGNFYVRERRYPGKDEKERKVRDTANRSIKGKASLSRWTQIGRP